MGTDTIDSGRGVRAFLVLRVVIAGLLAAHGWARFVTGGVEPFGGWLETQGLPFGLVIAAAVTALEIVGTPLLALGRGVTWLCLAYCAVYATGLVMVHLPAGWFVVGLGRNGMEYSVLLIVCLALLAWVHAPRRAGAEPAPAA
jgi:putative oxidoreductase